MSYYIYDSNGYVGDLASNNGLNELKLALKGKLFEQLFDDGFLDVADELRTALVEVDSTDKTVRNFVVLAKKCEDIVIITDGIFDGEEKSLRKVPTPSKSRGLTPDQKKLQWEVYAQKTARQEEVFKKVFDNVFEAQKNQVVAELDRTGHIPNELNDELTAQKFQPAIELVYHSAFEDAVPAKKQLDEFARTWILQRSLTLAKSINTTTLKALGELVSGMEAGGTVQQLAKQIEHWFSENEKWKAEMVARTETIAVNNEAVLHRFELEGVEKSEFYPSPGACDVCLEIAQDPIYLTKDSHDIIPVHPNCRCLWLGVVE